MSDNKEQSLEDRVRELERTIGRLLNGQGYRKALTVNSIRTDRIEITDTHGKTRVVLGCIDNGEHGYEHRRLSYYGLEVQTTDGLAMARLMSNDAGAEFDIYNGDGNGPVVWLTADDESVPNFQLRSEASRGGTRNKGEIDLFDLIPKSDES